MVLICEFVIGYYDDELYDNKYVHTTKANIQLASFGGQSSSFIIICLGKLLLLAARPNDTDIQILKIILAIKFSLLSQEISFCMNR